MSVLFAAIHHLLFFAMIGALVSQFVLLRTRVDDAVIKRIVGLDGMYGGAAVLVLVVGFCGFSISKRVGSIIPSAFHSG